MGNKNPLDQLAGLVESLGIHLEYRNVLLQKLKNNAGGAQVEKHLRDQLKQHNANIERCKTDIINTTNGITFE